VRRIVLFFLNNIFVNRILIWTGNDNLIKKFKANWTQTEINSNKSLQENMGFSHQKEIQEAVDKVHGAILDTYKTLLPGGSVLDIGCGAGLYLRNFPVGTVLYGTDLSKSFLTAAKAEVPSANLIQGDYLLLRLNKKFRFIFSVSVMQYIPPSKIKSFFRKIADELEPGGLALIQYPHALSYRHTLYPDLSYIHYSPQKIASVATEYMEIRTHFHSWDNRPMNGTFDSERYGTEGEKSFRNGTFILLRKN